MKSSRGQGLLETLLALPLMVTVGTVLGLLLYRSILYHASHYQAHEALICAQGQPVRVCQKELEDRIGKLVLGKTRWKVSVNERIRTYRVVIQIQLDPPLEIQSSMPRI